MDDKGGRILGDPGILFIYFVNNLRTTNKKL